jgi:hypothetical protein
MTEIPPHEAYAIRQGYKASKMTIPPQGTTHRSAMVVIDGLYPAYGPANPPHPVVGENVVSIIIDRDGEKNGSTLSIDITGPNGPEIIQRLERRLTSKNKMHDKDTSNAERYLVSRSLPQSGNMLVSANGRDNDVGLIIGVTQEINDTVRAYAMDRLGGLPEKRGDNVNLYIDSGDLHRALNTAFTRYGRGSRATPEEGVATRR